ncbi:hypothetical protein GWK47_049441 [Chionoecetes opilio]|uniref:Uncharacterized protein n=1 Tax=Chionoecetes opilio TaxID=41210 RepID=A0A8J4YBR8_CHIOP|nr:hypothetical protein GWK47_049441 [Chionoecetes opilio]
MTPATSQQRPKLVRRTTGLHGMDVPLGSARISAANMAHWACKEIKGIFDVHHEFGLGEQGGGHHQENGANDGHACKYFGVGNDTCGGRGGARTLEVGFGQPATCMPKLEEVAPAVLSCQALQIAHTLNLIATADVKSVAEWNQGLRAPFTKAAAKVQGTWNRRTAAYVVANSIK